LIGLAESVVTNWLVNPICNALLGTVGIFFNEWMHCWVIVCSGRCDRRRPYTYANWCLEQRYHHTALEFHQITCCLCSEQVRVHGPDLIHIRCF
jgi:hypothetical protein